MDTQILHTNHYHEHIITGDLWTITNSKIIGEGQSYR